MQKNTFKVLLVVFVDVHRGEIHVMTVHLVRQNLSTSLHHIVRDILISLLDQPEKGGRIEVERISV